MAWEISMTQEGWEDVRANLQYLAHIHPKTLVEGIASHVSYSGDFDVETGEYNGFNEKKYWAEVDRLNTWSPTALADEALTLIELNNTCTNGGWEVYLDDQGYTTIPVSLIPGAEQYLYNI